MKPNRSMLTALILIGLLLGCVTGAALNATLPDPAQAKAVAGYFSLITDVFLRLIKMIIAPLVIATLVSGIAHMGDARSIGRVGAKTMAWFLTASLASLLIGLLMAHVLQPGANLHLAIPPESAGVDVAGELSLRTFVTHIFPASVIDAMAKNEILQIVVFSLFAGIALGAMGEAARPVLTVVEGVATMMLKITDYVMKFAPVAVFSAVAATITTEGLGILGTYAAFVGGFYGSLALLWALLFAAGFAVLGSRVLGLAKRIRQPTLMAFSTASSEAAYPRTLEKLEEFGVSKRVASFVLPLGYSFNLDGSMMYMTFATLFIADAYGIELSLAQQFLMVAILMLTSKGIAGVPRASLVVIAGTLAFFDIPEAGLLLILGVDHFLDMGRSATNVIGNSIAAAAVAKWEGQLHPESTQDA